MHLVGFIIRIYRNAHSPERQTRLLPFIGNRKSRSELICVGMS